jgi:hypothetical protein
MVLSRPPPGGLGGAFDPTLQLLHQAVAAFNAGHWAEAERFARQVVTVRKNDPSALNVLGGAAMNTGRSEEAVPLFEAAGAFSLARLHAYEASFGHVSAARTKQAVRRTFPEKPLQCRPKKGRLCGECPTCVG